MEIIKKQIGTGSALLTGYVHEKSREYPYLDTRPAVLVFPGGGYRFCSDREADPVALGYARHGFHAFILRYTTTESCPVEQVFQTALSEAEEALSYLRDNAETLGIEPNHIATVGFSAGGHLSAALSLVGRMKADAMVLCYGAFTEAMNEGLGIQSPDILASINGQTPPTFLFTTQGDTTVPCTETLRFTLALAENKVPFESHTFLTGDHGLSMADETCCKGSQINPDVAEWHDWSVRFLRRIWSGESLYKGNLSSREPYSIDSPLVDLLDSSACTGILNQYLPGVMDRMLANPASQSLSLRKMGEHAKAILPEALLEKIDKELRAVNR